LLHRIAELEERTIGRADSAFKAHGRALRDDVTNETTIAHLERLAGVLAAQPRPGIGGAGAWGELADLYEDEIRKQRDPPRQVEMLLRLARVYEQEIARSDARAGSDKAIATYRRVLEVEPEQPTAILALDRLYQRAGRWNDLADILRNEIRLAADDEESLALQFRLGQLYQLELKD